jgi:hypothetical protein
MKSSSRGSSPPGGADVPSALWRRWRRQRQGKRRTSQTWPPGAAAAGTSCGGRSRSNTLRTSSEEGKRQWVMNDCESEDARDPTTAAAAADGNEDDDKNDSDDDDDRRTSSALISL